MNHAAVLKRTLFHAGLDAYSTLVVLVVISEGGGGKEMVPIESTVFEAALGVKDPRTVRRAIARAESLDILIVERPGYGRSNRYRVDVEVLTTGHSRQTSDAHLEASRGTSHAHLDALRSAFDAHLEPTRGTSDVPLSSSSRGRSKKRDEQNRAREVSHTIDMKVNLTLDGDECDGFRGALRDYLGDRVPTDRQWGYVNTIRTWLQGASGGPKNFFKVDEDQRRLTVAQALNEFLELSPQEEAKMFKSARGIPGTTSALRAKIEYLLNRGGENGRPNGNGGAKRAPRRGAVNSPSIGDNFTGFPESAG